MARHSTSPKVIEEFNKAYSSPVTPWEYIKPTDLADAFVEFQLNPWKISSILEIGCGRGQRLMHLLAKVPALNRRDVSILAIDVAEKAIEGANAVLQEENRQREESGLSKLQCGIRFLCEDVVNLPIFAKSQKYDLIIDWMCFHELYPASVNDYEKIIADAARKFLLIKTFSEEGNKGIDLGFVVPDVRKKKFTEQSLLHNLGANNFTLMRTKYHERNEGAGHPDGAEAAKMTCLLVRKLI